MKKRLLWLALIPLSLGALHVAHTAHAATDPHPMEVRALTHQLALWDGSSPTEEVTAMRRMNPEWDFMQRTFMVLSLANRAAEDPTLKADYLPVIDRILADTLAMESQHGQHWYLLSYADRKPFQNPSGRSLFVDGEVAVMLGARLMLEDEPQTRTAFQARIALIESEMRAGPLLSAESYPDEIWTFCNSFALVALRMDELTSGADHSQLTGAWIEMAKANLIDPATGMLISSYNYKGTRMDGPEGSSIWLVSTNLMLFDPEFANAQYTLAKEHLGARVANMAYAKEWPERAQGVVDVDSGPIIPGLDASASSSGFALLAATAFQDAEHEIALRRALDAADLMLALDPELAAAADNPVGESVLLYAMSFGPLWAQLAEAPSQLPS